MEGRWGYGTLDIMDTVIQDPPWTPVDEPEAATPVMTNEDLSNITERWRTSQALRGDVLDLIAYVQFLWHERQAMTKELAQLRTDNGRLVKNLRMALGGNAPNARDDLDG